MLRYVRYDQPATSLLKQLNVGISNTFEVPERTTLAVQSTVEVFHDFICQSALHPFGHLS